MEFRKTLARSYKIWFIDCLDSAIYCLNRDDYERAEQYIYDALKYFKIIAENYKAIEFFSIKNNAFLKDEALPEEFRGYK